MFHLMGVNHSHPSNIQAQYQTRRTTNETQNITSKDVNYETVGLHNN